jgi:Secretion system C-terminal sorting domain
MNKVYAILLYVSLFIFIHISTINCFAQPVMRDGWPQQFGEYYPNLIQDQATSWILDENGQVIIASCSQHKVALYDLNGNIHSGWPTQVDYRWYIVDGPHLGDINGDGDIEVAILARSLWADSARVIIYDKNGIEIPYFTNEICFTPPLTVFGKTILYDIDDDGVDNLSYIADSIYAFDSNGEPLEGFPKLPLAGEVGSRLGFVFLPDNYIDGKGIAYNLKDSMNVRYLDSFESLPGWPIPLNVEKYCTSPLIVPYEDSWALAYYIDDSLHVRGSDGNHLPRYPIYIRARFEQVKSLTATDIDLDGVPEIALQKAYGKIWLHTLTGYGVPGFETGYTPGDYFGGFNEDILSYEILGSENANLIYSQQLRIDMGINQYGFMGLSGSTPMDGFPYLYEELWEGYGTFCSIIWTGRDDILHLVFSGNIGLVFVLDLPMPGATIRTLWPMPGGNPGGNRVYEPGTYVGVDEGDMSHIPDDFTLFSAYPNPFNNSVNIPFELPENAHVKITIYDILGRKAATVVNQMKTSGQHIISWNGSDGDNFDLPSGIYFVRMEAGSFTQTQKIMLLK